MAMISGKTLKLLPLQSPRLVLWMAVHARWQTSLGPQKPATLNPQCAGWLWLRMEGITPWTQMTQPLMSSCDHLVSLKNLHAKKTVTSLPVAFSTESTKDLPEITASNQGLFMRFMAHQPRFLPHGFNPRHHGIWKTLIDEAILGDRRRLSPRWRFVPSSFWISSGVGSSLSWFTVGSGARKIRGRMFRCSFILMFCSDRHAMTFTHRLR